MLGREGEPHQALSTGKGIPHVKLYLGSHHVWPSPQGPCPTYTPLPAQLTFILPVPCLCSSLHQECPSQVLSLSLSPSCWHAPTPRHVAMRDSVGGLAVHLPSMHLFYSGSEPDAAPTLRGLPTDSVRGGAFAPSGVVCLHSRASDRIGAQGWEGP